MGVFEHFPYVNYHELNFSWVIDKLKELENVIGSQIVDIVARAGVAANAEAIHELTETVNNVQTTANNALDTADNAVDTAEDAQTTATTANTSVTNLTTTVNNIKLQHSDHTFTNIQIGQYSHYALLGVVNNVFDNVPENAYYVSASIRGWSGSNGSISLGFSSDGTSLYVFDSEADTLSTLTVRLWYVMEG